MAEKESIAVNAAHVELEEDKEENCERPESRTAVTEERQGNTYYRNQSDNHSDIDKDVEGEDGGDTVAVDLGKDGSLPLCEPDEAKDEGHVEENEKG